jgi:homoserine kinase
MVTITVPASTANLGPGFDVLGAALSLYLKITVEPSATLQIHYRGDGTVPVDETNFIHKIATMTANIFHKRLPTYEMWIENPIFLGRGLGSSGSAVVGGILVASCLLKLDLDKQTVLDIATLVEGHPDNVGASIYGGFITAFIRGEIPEFQDTWCTPGATVPYVKNLVHITPLNISGIRAVVCVPDYQVPTSEARKVLPSSYSRKDIVYNLGRIVGLVKALENKEYHVVREAMKDKIHQEYRQVLVLGLKECLELELDGLLGVSLSGAGPTVFALCTNNSQIIGNQMQRIFESQGIQSQYVELDISCGYTINDN